MTQAVIQLLPDAKSEISKALNQCVADTVVATMLAQNFYWNVTGMAFLPLHQLFQEIYEDHFQAQDDLAERVKVLDAHVDATLKSVIERSTVVEHSGKDTDRQMIQQMLDAEQVLVSSLATCGTLAAKHDDTLTEDLCIARGQEHEKFAWMLRAHLR